MNALSAPIDAEAIIAAVYPGGGPTRELLLRHGERVGRKAISILDRAPWLSVDREFVYQAAMLHDIGIGRTRCPELGCTGDLPHVHHGSTMTDRFLALHRFFTRQPGPGDSHPISSSSRRTGNSTAARN